jgi:hypothetical protein
MYPKWALRAVPILGTFGRGGRICTKCVQCRRASEILSRFGPPRRRSLLPAGAWALDSDLIHYQAWRRAGVSG